MAAAADVKKSKIVRLVHGSVVVSISVVLYNVRSFQKLVVAVVGVSVLPSGNDTFPVSIGLSMTPSVFSAYEEPAVNCVKYVLSASPFFK